MRCRGVAASLGGPTLCRAAALGGLAPVSTPESRILTRVTLSTEVEQGCILFTQVNNHHLPAQQEPKPGK